MKRIAVLLLTLYPAWAFAESPKAQFERSVVRIVNYSQRGDWMSPWDTTAVRTSSGTGFVIDGGLVMTNAHVVSDARMLLILVHGDPTPHEARVVVSGHDCDLALIEPVESGLLDGVPRLGFGGLPKVRSTVETYGYPAGGDQISSTRGVVSRIEAQVYSHSRVDRHLAIQTDAAINPGNSGGPVVQGSRVVGVAFQGAGGLENVGFFIPVEVIQHFLTDVKDGRYDGYPDLAIDDSTLENPADRAEAGLLPAETGVRVDLVVADGASDGILRPGDVLLAADGYTIANDGSVVSNGLRLDYTTAVERHQVGETVPLRILRNGQRQDVRIRLLPHPATNRVANAWDRMPRYFIYGGLVFEPLEVETLKTEGQDWARTADRRLLYELLLRGLGDPAAHRRERVVLLRRLDHPVNAKISWFRNQLVEKVNGRPVDSLADLVRILESSTGPYDVFELGEPGRFVVLDREAALAAGPEILERYGVPKDRNP